MKYTGLIFFTAFLSYMIIGCSSHKNEKLLSKIDSLQLEIDSANIALTELDSAYILKLADTTDSNITLIKKLIKDSLQKEDGFLVSDYKYINKSFQKYGEKNEELFEEVNYSRNQLSSLYNDVKKGLIDSAKAMEFYKEEEKATSEISDNVKTFTGLMQSKVESFRSKNPEIKTLIDSLSR